MGADTEGIEQVLEPCEFFLTGFYFPSNCKQQKNPE